MLKHPIIKKEEAFLEVTVGNGEHFDIFTVDKVYVSELGKVRIYINRDYDIEVLDLEWS